MKTCHKNGLQSATKEMDSEVRGPTSALTMCGTLVNHFPERVKGFGCICVRILT